MALPRDVPLVAEPSAFGIVQGFVRDRRVVERAEEVDLNLRCLDRTLDRKVAVDDTLADAVAVVAAGHVPEDLVAARVVDWLLAHDDDRWVVQGDAAELTPNAFGANSF